MSFSQVTIMGNLCRDPELKFTKTGRAICDLSIAINRKWKNEQGETKEEVCFVDVVAWGKAGETIKEWFHKGDMIIVRGHLQMDQWETQQGEKKTKLKVCMEAFNFCGGKKESGQSQNQAQQASQQNRQQSNARQTTAPPANQQRPPTPQAQDNDDIPYDDDSSEIPF